MLPSGLGRSGNLPIFKTLKPATSSFICVRCAGCELPKDSTHVAAICASGHVQCGECDLSMRHLCKRCGAITTILQRQDIESKPKTMDPRSLTPEQLTQLELNDSLVQLKNDYLKAHQKEKTKEMKRRKRLNLMESTIRVIEILNPNLIPLYKQVERYTQTEVEDHFYRTSEKAKHSFTWHKVALDFLMKRIISVQVYNDLRIDDSLFNASYHFSPEGDLICKESIPSSANQKSSTSHQKKKSSKRKNAKSPQKKTLIQNVFYNNEFLAKGLSSVGDQSNLVSEPIKKRPLIFVKPTTWLTEFSCPHCELFLRLSDFSKHFAIHHCLPIECMELDTTRYLVLDPNIVSNRAICPHKLFLLKNVVRNFGGSEYKNFYPIVLITAAFLKSDLLRVDESTKCEDKLVMLWLSGIALGDEIQICLKIISNSETDLMQCTALNNLYPITREQNLKEIYQSREALILSPEMFRAITKNGTEGIVLEISLRGRNKSNV